MRYMKPTPKQERGYQDWMAGRPERVRAVASRFDPWSLYRMDGEGGKRVTIYGFEEDNGKVSVRVDILAEFNLVTHERQRFGVDPDTLTPCDLPGPNEQTGVIYDEKEQLEFINLRRAINGLPPMDDLFFEEDGGKKEK